MKKFKLKQSKFLYLLFILLLIPFFQAYAHSGRTASDGCHYCRTNCDKWGVEWNARHCHRSKGISQPSEPIRSHFNETGGYTTPAPDYKVSEVKIDPVPVVEIIPTVIKPTESSVDTKPQKTIPKPTTLKEDYKKPIVTKKQIKSSSTQTAIVVQRNQKEVEKTFWLIRFFKFVFGF